MRVASKAANYLFAFGIAAVFVVWFVLLRPASLGGPVTYVMVSGISMEPTLVTGDLAVVRKQDAYKPGDIVAFRVPEGDAGEGATIIHRIADSRAQGGFVMKGDNKKYADPWHPTKDDVMGRMWFHVPGAARYLARLRQPLPLASLLAGLGTLVIVLGEGRRMRRGGPVPLPGPELALLGPRVEWQPRWVALPLSATAYVTSQPLKTRKPAYYAGGGLLLAPADIPVWQRKRLS